MKIKQIRNKILQSKWFTLPVMIGSTIALLMFFRWIGIKGIIGFILGMTIMCYLMMSKNPMLRMVLMMTEAKQEELSEEYKK